MANYIVVQDWMLDLGLSASEINALALIWGFTQDGQHTCHASREYIGRFCAIKEKANVSRMLNRMVEKGVISIDHTYGSISEYRVSEVVSKRHGGSVETTRGVVSKRHGGSVETTPPYNNVDNKSIIKSDSDASADAEPTPLPRRRKGSVPPTLDEVREYAAAHGASEDLATNFWLHYQGVGWKSGNTPLKTWYPIFLKWVKNSD